MFRLQFLTIFKELVVSSMCEDHLSVIWYQFTDMIEVIIKIEIFKFFKISFSISN
jgi:hypothetical protein